jgi:DNA repair protein RecO (recombination protein O)
MPLRQCEAIVLRTYALKEADKIVSFFSRDQGKCRGAARGARRMNSGFGSSLEPLSLVRVTFFERQNRDLGTIDRCDLLHSMVPLQSGDFTAACVLAYIAEVTDRILPDHEVNDPVFRLLTTVLTELRGGAPLWLPLTYFMYWMVRLGGFLPDLGACGHCRRPIAESDEAWFAADSQEIRCGSCRSAGATALETASRQWAQVLARAPLASLPHPPWSKAACALDLRRFLNFALEHHVEAHFKSWPMLVEAAS